jgi:hypothetical protein
VTTAPAEIRARLLAQAALEPGQGLRRAPAQQEVGAVAAIGEHRQAGDDRARAPQLLGHELHAHGVVVAQAHDCLDEQRPGLVLPDRTLLDGALLGALAIMRVALSVAVVRVIHRAQLFGAHRKDRHAHGVEPIGATQGALVIALRVHDAHGADQTAQVAHAQVAR